MRELLIGNRQEARDFHLAGDGELCNDRKRIVLVYRNGIHGNARYRGVLRKLNAAFWHKRYGKGVQRVVACVSRFLHIVVVYVSPAV